jgi:hypothetical protein
LVSCNLFAPFYKDLARCWRAREKKNQWVMNASIAGGVQILCHPAG